MSKTKTIENLLSKRPRTFTEIRTATGLSPRQVALGLLQLRQRNGGEVKNLRRTPPGQEWWRANAAGRAWARA